MPIETVWYLPGPFRGEVVADPNDPNDPNDKCFEHPSARASEQRAGGGYRPWQFTLGELLKQDERNAYWLRVKQGPVFIPEVSEDGTNYAP